MFLKFLVLFVVIAGSILVGNVQSLKPCCVVGEICEPPVCNRYPCCDPPTSEMKP